MITVTKNDFFNFIKSQSDNKELNFSEFKSNSFCGCPMIHYAREVLKENNLNASTSDWYGRINDCRASVRFEDGFNLTSFMPLVKETDMLPTTYGELKRSLVEKYPEFNWKN